MEASDGAATLKLLEQNPDVHLLFTDVVLRGHITGAQLAAGNRAGGVQDSGFGSLPGHFAAGEHEPWTQSGKPRRTESIDFRLKSRR